MYDPNHTNWLIYAPKTDPGTEGRPPRYGSPVPAAIGEGMLPREDKSLMGIFGPGETHDAL